MLCRTGGGMAVSLLPKAVSDIQVKSVTGTFPGGATNQTITATIPEGWKFLAWVGSASSGWVGMTFIENMDHNSSYIWKATERAIAGNFIAYYLIYK